MDELPDATAVESLAATLTSLAASATAALNSSDSSPFLQGGLVEDDPTNDGNPVVNFILGFIIVIGASILNAFGLNLTKLDHVSWISMPI